MPVLYLLSICCAPYINSFNQSFCDLDAIIISQIGN